MLPLPSQVGAMASASSTAAPELLAAWASAVGARAGTALLGGVSNLVDGTASSLSAPPGDPLQLVFVQFAPMWPCGFVHWGWSK